MWHAMGANPAAELTGPPGSAAIEAREAFRFSLHKGMQLLGDCMACQGWRHPPWAELKLN